MARKKKRRRLGHITPREERIVITSVREAFKVCRAGSKSGLQDCYRGVENVRDILLSRLGMD